MIGRDLLGIEDLERSEIEILLETAEHMKEIATREVKKVPTLRGQTVVNLFFEPSTRTASSFEIAGKRLSADVVNISVHELESCRRRRASSTPPRRSMPWIPTASLCVTRLRVSRSASPTCSKAPVVNAGDGAHEHPTQALLDMLTVKQEKGRIDGLSVAIVGDIAHSRVARSNIYGFTRMGAEVRVTGPPTMLPPFVETLGVKPCASLREAIEGADVVMMLRIPA